MVCDTSLFISWILIVKIYLFLRKMKINQAIKYIFVDYFDTTCFRHIHSSQIYLQWAKVMRAKFPELVMISWSL